MHRQTSSTMRIALPGILALGVVLAVAGWLRQRLDQSPVPSAGTPGAEHPAATDPLAPIALAMRKTQAPESLQERLLELRGLLSRMSPESASAAIRGFLDTGTDASTRLDFKLDARGFLTEAPSLRVFLLDYLAQVDAKGAAVYARTVLDTMESPDEWAVALRNIALGDPGADARALLERKMGEMLRNIPWQQEPSTGFLEAFDVAVYLGGTNLIPALSEMVRKKDNPAVAHAAYLALDRIVIDDPATTLGVLQASPDLMRGREPTRANYFARADVRDPRQRQVLESYLLDSRIDAAELRQFTGLYPSANFMISHNLLTHSATPDHADLTGRDAESLRVLREWLADPRFERLRPELEESRLRLEEFVRQANQAR